MYKKYITKKGKKVGPYYYDSIRLKNGRVKTVYLGSDLKNAKHKLKVLRKESSKAVHERSSATLKKSLNPRSSARLIGDHKVHMKDRVFLSIVLILMLVGFMHFGGILDGGPGDEISGGFVTGFRTFSDMARDSFSQGNLKTDEVVSSGNKITGDVIFSGAVPEEKNKHELSLLVSESAEYNLNFEGIDKLTSLKLSGRIASFEDGVAKVFLSDADSGDTYLVYDSGAVEEGILGAVGITGSVVLGGGEVVEEPLIVEEKNYRDVVSSLTGFNVVDSKGRRLKYDSFNSSNGTSILHLKDKESFEIKYPKKEGWIAFEEYSSRGLLEPTNISFNKVFGFDFSGLNLSLFNETNTSVSTISEGDYLYGCSFWDFEFGICLSDWVYFFDINNTENYTVGLTKEVMAFAEGIFDPEEEKEEPEEELEEVEEEPEEEVDLLVNFLEAMNISNYTIDSFNSECEDVCKLKNVLSKNFILKFYIQNSALELNLIETGSEVSENSAYSVSFIDSTGTSVLGGGVVDTPAVDFVVNVTNETIDVVDKGAYTEETTQYGAVVGKPVKWKKKVLLDNSTSNLRVEVPDEARNIVLNKVVEGEVLSVDSAELDEGNGTIVSLVNETSDESFIDGLFNGITGNAITGLVIADETVVSDLVENGSLSENDTVIIGDIVKEVIVEYETPAPTINIENSSRGLRVVLKSDLIYENVLSFVNIPESDPNKVRLYRVLLDNGTGKEIKKENNFVAKDNTGDGFVDYLEWVIPVLENNETYDVIIEIVSAEHRDINYSFISDIYNETYKLDGIWSEPIYADEYVRVVFEENLTKYNDITVYVRNNESSNTFIEVYSGDLSRKITEYPLIFDEGYYKVLLTNLSVPSDTFNLRIRDTQNVNTSFLEFDHILDPNEIPNVTINSPVNGTNYASGTAGVELVVNVTDDLLPVDNVTLTIYAANHSNPQLEDLVYKDNVTNGTQVTYNFSKRPFEVDSDALFGYHFDQVLGLGESSTNVYDWANVQNGTPVGDAAVNFSNAIFGGNFEFDGNGDRLRVKAYTGLQHGWNATFMGWVRSKDLTQSRMVFGQGVFDPTSSPNNYLGLFFAQDSGKFTVAHGNNVPQGGLDTLETAGFFLDTEWTHLAVTRFKNGTYHVYRNGALNNSGAVTGATWVANIFRFHIGSSDDTGGANTLPWNGAVDDFIVINRTLTSEEINQTLKLTDTTYYWNASGDDSELVNNSDLFQFSIGANTVPYVALNAPSNESVFTDAGTIQLNVTVTDGEDDTFGVTVYGSNGTGAGDILNSEILYQNESWQNNTNISYNWTAPVLQPTINHLLLAHFDNNSNFGENSTKVFDFGDADGVQNGTLNGGSSINESEGKIGGAYNATASATTDRIDFGDQDSWIGVGNLSYLMWVRPMDVTTTGGIFGKGQINLLDDDPGLAVLQVGKDLRIAPSEETFDIVGLFENGEWYHLALVFNESNGFDVYINGEHNSTFGFVQVIANNNAFVIGNRFTSLSFNQPYVGYIDEFAVLNRSLTAQEVADAYKLKSGNHTWFVDVNDTSSSNSSDAWMFEIDRKPNITSISIGPTGANRTSGINCTFTPIDDLDSTVDATVKYYNESNLLKTNTPTGLTSNVSFTDNLSAFTYEHFENYSCNVTVTDVQASVSDQLNSLYVFIENYEPGTAVLNSPYNTTTHTNRTPTFNWTPADEFNRLPSVGNSTCVSEGNFFCQSRTSDPDQDQVNYTLNLSCFVTTGGTCDDEREYNVVENSTNCDANANGYLDNEDNCTFTLPTDLVYFFDDNRYYEWTVKSLDPYVQEENLPTTIHYNLSVLVALDLLDSFVDFGTIGLGVRSETSACNLATQTPTPCPIWIENSGNVKADLNITGPTVAFWDTQSLPHALDYFGVKVGEGTEGSSFDTADSNITYRIMPASGVTEKFINNLSKTDSADEARIDFNISVPDEELEGAKGIILELTTWYGEVGGG